MSYQNPNFDKDEYWKRRSIGLSGTGFYYRKRGYVTGQHATVGNKPVSKKAILKNTKRARKALI